MEPSGSTASPAERPEAAGGAGIGRILLAINSSWNVVNFRGGLVKSLLSAGYSVVVAAPRDGHSAAVERLGCAFAELPMRPHGRAPLQELRLLMRLLHVIRRERPDCILAYTAKPNVYASLAAALCRVPVINNVPGLGLVFNESGATARILKLLYRIALRRSARVFFQNRDDMALFLAARLVPPDVIDLLPGSGIDLKRFAPAARPEGPLTFLLIARLLWEKGIGEYVEAGRAVRALHPDARIRILGFIDEGSAGVPRATIAAWQREGAIDYLGSAADVRPHIAAADCVVLPSYYREGTPRTLLEAAAMGKPIITTDMPGCRDVVDDGRNGFVVPPRDAAALARSMQAMARLSGGRRAEMGAASRAKAERDYDERIVIDRYLAALAMVRDRAASRR